MTSVGVTSVLAEVFIVIQMIAMIRQRYHLMDINGTECSPILFSATLHRGDAHAYTVLVQH